jgi:hypothetical protein
MVVLLWSAYKSIIFIAICMPFQTQQEYSFNFNTLNASPHTALGVLPSIFRKNENGYQEFYSTGSVRGLNVHAGMALIDRHVEPVR